MVIGIASFNRFEFCMVGVILVYHFTALWLPGTRTPLVITMACVIVFALDATFERNYLTAGITRWNMTEAAYGFPVAAIGTADGQQFVEGRRTVLPGR